MGGNNVCAFQFAGFVDIREDDSLAMAVMAAKVWERALIRKEYKGGGNVAERYSSRGSKNAGKKSSTGFIVAMYVVAVVAVDADRRRV